VNVVRHRNDPIERARTLEHAALPFLVLAVLFVAGASSTMLPTALAFVLIVACVLIGALRVLLVYRDRLVAQRRTGARR